MWCADLMITKKQTKNKFWETLANLTEDYENRIFVIGDFNARVERRNKQNERVVWVCTEETRNNNEQRLFDYYMENGHVIANNFYMHKNIHKFTIVRESRNEKSIIYYDLIDRKHRNEI